MNPGEAKSQIRVVLRERVAAMSPGARAVASGQIADHLAASSVWQAAAVVMLYAADASEPHLDGLISAGVRDGKTVCLPRIDWDAKRMMPASVRGPEDLVADRHGIRVPGPACDEVPLESVVLVVVPGVGFDLDGGRVGRGGGFYDRFLAGRTAGGPIRTVSLGACFSTQVVGRVPRGPHDRCVDGLVTETGLVMFERDTEGPR